MIAICRKPRQDTPARCLSELRAYREIAVRQDALMREIAVWLVFNENRLAGLR
jgi:hypothetical protein